LPIMAILVVKSPSGPMLAKPPMEPHWEDLTWSWAWSTGHIASDQKLEPAAKAAWPYALLCAWTYLNDRDSAHDLMEHAVRNAGEYFVRHPDSTEQKLTARIRSVIRRRAKQIARQRRREIASGSLLDLEHLGVAAGEVEERAIANELFSRLSPFAQNVLNRREFGYTWREIAAEVDLDHTVVRRAYFRELQSLLRSLSRPGEPPR
jgi:DNA-directed RNA polymerase specialized sigma24 family protein